MIKLKTLSNWVLFVYTFGVYLGPRIFAVNIGFMHVTIDRLLQPVMLAMCFWKIIPYVHAHGLKIPVKTNTYSVTFFIIWLAYSILTGMWAPDYNAWLKGNYYLFSGMLMILTFSLYIDDARTVEQILTISMCMSIVHLCIGFYEIVTGKYLFLVAERLTSYRNAHYPVSCMSDVNEYATLIMIGIFSSIAVYMVSNRKIVKFISFMAATSMIMMCVLFTRSRGVIFGLIVSLFAICLLMHNVRRKVFLLLMGTGAVIFIVLVAIYPVIDSNLANVLDMIRSDIFYFSPLRQGGSDFIRMNLIRNGLVFLVENLLLGVGTGCITHYLRHHSIYNTYNIFYMHNWWMEILVSNGIFIFIAYCVFYARLIKHLFSNIKVKYLVKHPNDLDFMAWCLGAFAIAYTIASVSGASNLCLNVIWHYFAVAIAVEGMVEKGK